MASDKEKWEQFAKKNPKIKIDIQEKYLINNREMVLSSYLEKLWGVTDKTIRNYVNAGMPVSEHSSARFKIFDLVECLSWRMNEINLSKSNVSKTQQKESETESIEKLIQDANKRKIIADANSAEHEETVKRVKAEVAKGNYVLQALVHVSELYNDRKILPTLLEQKTKERIIELLERHHSGRVSNLKEIISKEFDCDETLYEVCIEVLELLKILSPLDIIKKLKK